MIYQEVNFSDFVDAFHEMERSDSFSYDGLTMLFDYYNNAYSDCNPYELDVIEICTLWSEYSSLEEMLEETEKDSIDEVKYQATVLYKDEDGPFVVRTY